MEGRRKLIEDGDYGLEEVTESDEEVPLRRRAESVAVVSWRLVCSCMILVRGVSACCKSH